MVHPPLGVAQKSLVAITCHTCTCVGEIKTSITLFKKKKSDNITEDQCDLSSQ